MWTLARNTDILGHSQAVRQQTLTLFATKIKRLNIAVKTI